MIPNNIIIKDLVLPSKPGVYFYYDNVGKLLYIGKATSLKRRVRSYFNKAHDQRISSLVSSIARIDYIVTPSVIEALILEANQIKIKKPLYNILQRDDKSFLYLVITNEDFPKPMLIRGKYLVDKGIDPFSDVLSEDVKKLYVRIFGPYTSSTSLRKAMDIIRDVISWSNCNPPIAGKSKRSCFNYHIKKCPGVCVGNISKQEYRKIIKSFILFFEGKKIQIIRSIKKEMLLASKELRFEDAKQFRKNIFALEHIQDVSLIVKEDTSRLLCKSSGEIDLNGRIEAYDISHISGMYAVGSMVVFKNQLPLKSSYRKFTIKTVSGNNDVAMIVEVVVRRLNKYKLYPNKWPLPDLMVIDGGKSQVNAVCDVLKQMVINVPVIGIAKGPGRKQDKLIFDRSNQGLIRIEKRGKELCQNARDEAHRFAVKFHRLKRKKGFIK